MRFFHSVLTVSLILFNAWARLGQTRQDIYIAQQNY